MKSFSLVGKLLFWIGVASVACAASPSSANEMVSGAQLKEHIRSVLLSRGLDSMPIIAGSRQFRACKAPLQVSPMFGGYKTVRLSCPDDDGFKIAVRTQIDKIIDNQDKKTLSNIPENKLAKFVVMTKSIQRGKVIRANDVALVKRAVNPGFGYYSNIKDVVGRKAKKSLSINQTIRNRHLELDFAIQKDQSVIIESKIGPVTVISAGIAISDAQIGELVKVKNNSSELIIEGVVISEKKIQVRAK